MSYIHPDRQPAGSAVTALARRWQFQQAGRQTIDDDDIAAVVEALRSPLLTCGPLVARFEAALSDRLGPRG
jgi:dTDP-4-amino-4,6-dideoxygalactose transaminase